jgi:hypothetical protein
VPAPNARYGRDVDEGEQEQPDHVHEVPVPGSEFEAEVFLRRHATGKQADQAYDQEQRTDHNVGTVEAGRHEEGRTIERTVEAELCVAVFEHLQRGEGHAEQDGDEEAQLCAGTVVMLQRVVRPGNSGTRQEQDQRVDQRQVERVERFDANRRPILEFDRASANSGLAASHVSPTRALW